VRTSDDAKAVEILAGLDWVEGVETKDDRLIVTVAHERSSELTAALSRSEVYVTEIAPLQISLEQYFLDVTGENGAKAE